RPALCSCLLQHGLFFGRFCHELFFINIRFFPSSGQRVMTFARILEENKIPVTIRQSRGQDIEAACGELYATQKKERGGSQ
ncbi:MAG: hypothetical protein WCP87_03100, partial [Atribacterota bacterium]